MIGCGLLDGEKSPARIGEGVAAADTAGWPVNVPAGLFEAEEKNGVAAFGGKY